jgi:tetratricopeptide (TPR) repeat protein
LLEVCVKWGEIGKLDARVEIAEEFHYVDDFQPARDILATVFGLNPEHAAATILMGDIAVHERSWSDALRWTQRALLLAPGEMDAHEDRVDALIGAQDWAAAVSACGAALELVTDQTVSKQSSLRLERARCFMELGDFPAAGNDLDRVLAEGRPSHANAARALRAEWLVRQGRWAEAQIEGVAGLQRRPYLWNKALLTAAVWEARHRLGVDNPTPVPTARHIELLRWHGRHAWVERLLSLGLKPETDRPTRRRAELARRLRGQLVRL